MTQLSAAQTAQTGPSDGSKALYGGKGTRRITVRDIAAAKERGEKWPMLTAYDAMTASVFDEAGIPVMLVGDSAGNCHLGYETTVPVTLDEMTMLSAAVVRGTSRALIVGDLPFGSYQEGPVQALRSATRLVKEAGVGAVKLEGGERSHEQIRAARRVRHPGHGPHRPDPAVRQLHGLPRAGPRRGGGPAAAARREGRAGRGRVRGGPGTGPGRAGRRGDARPAHPDRRDRRRAAETDAQVLVWTDMLGLTGGRVPKFVKQYANLREVMGDAAKAFAEDVVGGTFPQEEHAVH